MARPSRFMPAFMPETQPIRWRVAAFIVLGIGLCCFAWAVWAKPLPVLAGLAAVVLFGAIVTHRQRRRLLAKAQSRAGESICSFARALPIHELDSWVVRAVFEQLQLYVLDAKSRFPIRPSDRLVDDLLVDAEDLDDVLAPEIAQRTGRSLSGPENNPYYGKVVTVEDLVRFFCAQPKRGGAAEQGVEADEAR
jgi:hypothetical protein